MTNQQISAKELVMKLMSKDWTINTHSGVKTINILNDLNYYFEFNSRLSNVLGRCNYTHKRIQLSTKYVNLNWDKHRDMVEDTIRHEIAHAIAYHLYGKDGLGHGYYWQNVAKQLGATPKARSKNSSNIVSTRKKRNIIFECPNCDNQISFARMPKKTRACGSCCNKHSNGKYDTKYKFILKSEKDLVV